MDNTATCTYGSIQDTDDKQSLQRTFDSGSRRSSTFDRITVGIREYVSNLSLNAKSLFLSFFAFLGHLLLSVILLILSSTYIKIGSDAYIVIIVDGIWEFMILLPVFLVFSAIVGDLPWKSFAPLKALLIYGLSSALTGTFIVFASLPERTPPYLQSILGSALIPFVVVCRYVMLRKGISIRRGVCIVIVMIGLFITMEPRIWGLTGSSGTGTDTVVSSAARILWPLSFVFAFLPDAVTRVVTEQQLKRSKAQTLNFLTYGSLSSLLCSVIICWVDLIPGFGMADSVGQLWTRFSVGMRCSVSSDTSCYSLAVKVWIMVSAHVIGYVFHFLLIKYAEGAILASLVQAMRTPIASIFWTLYHYDESKDLLYWSPEFNITTCFLIGGLVIVLPGMLVYNYFSNEEMMKELKKDLVINVEKDVAVVNAAAPS